MKKTGIVIIMLFLIVMSCKKESDMYSFFRPTHPKNLKTLADGEFYSWAATDSAIIRADYFLNIQGEITTYGDSIIAYGHCWSAINANPSIGHDFDTIYNLSIFPGNTSTYVSYLSNLDADTEYNIRSFAIFGDANGAAVDTGYNPVVSKISTLPAIDEWFEQFGDLRPPGARFDAVAFNLGDTIFFGTGDQGQKLLKNDIHMYDPATGKWEFFLGLPSVRLPVVGENREILTNATGFALSFHDLNAPEGEFTRCIYVGLGDYEGGDSRDYKSNTMIEIDLNDGSFRESEFAGFIRSGMVSFTIGSKAYVGTGSNSVAMNDWWVFDPVADRDGNPLTFGWQQISKPGGNNAVARTGAIGFSINGIGYFGLGKDADGNFLKDFWEFRPNDKGTNGTWIQKAPFPGEARQNAAAFVIGSQGYIGTGDNIVGDMEGGPYTGQTFSDVYRYDPFNDRWRQIRDYTLDKTLNTTNPKSVTRASGFGGVTLDIGYIGFGIMPEETQRAQNDFWQYQPWQAGAAPSK